MPLLFSEYSSNNFQQCFTREGLVEVVGSILLHRGSPNFGILNSGDESKPNLQIARLCPAGTASIPPLRAREGWTETRLIRVPIRNKSIAALPSAGSRPSKPPHQSIGTTMSRTGFLSSTSRMRGRVRGWILALTAEKAIVLVSIECSFSGHRVLATHASTAVAETDLCLSPASASETLSKSEVLCEVWGAQPTLWPFSTRDRRAGCEYRSQMEDSPADFFGILIGRR